ncbi:DUF3576 domain-containing protein [Thetidibacter halocola]|uniref:DUF3576 domain-containing protein n=1 Tax=Thetidibacter halocola TaxID=2827239 RepID=A0A8J7WHQ6_9RHOB|nr:DUF3576 domain-containing protein [Thetidibacter halocola]MBS0125516.1 DUF3576 domain-containing protein [Thetidibacter halocola]
MHARRIVLGIGLSLALLAQAGCGLFPNRADRAPVDTPSAEEILDDIRQQRNPSYRTAAQGGTTIWDALRPRGDQGQVGAVNKYIWNAALETLDFLPVESVDPFSGVITTGYGTPPGGGQSYRATILVNDPALDARSLNVALMTRSGPAPAATVRAVEDAILTRARQLRARDSRL